MAERVTVPEPTPEQREFIARAVKRQPVDLTAVIKGHQPKRKE